MQKIPVTVIVLTFNEEKNIEDCLTSIVDWVDEIIVLDSYSTDSTIALVRKYTGKIYYNKFENYAVQRNWALDNIAISNDWVLNMDSDHRATSELKLELNAIFENKISNTLNGFLISRKTIFLGTWIKHGGHYPTYHANLFRKGKGKCELKNYDQHFLVEGAVQILKSDMIDIITNSLTNFIDRHNKWATLEAQEAISIIGAKEGLVKPNKNGNPIERRRFMKIKYYSYPIFLRAFIYFFIRYIIRFGFLDGKNGLIFHFLQCLWFRFLVDAKITELNSRLKK